MNIKLDPNFQRLRKALLLEGKADRVPLFDFNIHGYIKKQILGRPVITAQDEVDFWVDAGYDYVQIRLKPNSYQEKLSQTINSSHGNIKSLEDLNKSEFEWTPIYKNTWNLSEYNLEYIKQIAEKLPDNMKLIVHAADIFTRSWIVMGFEDFCYAIYEQPELVNELFMQNSIAEQRMLDTIIEIAGDKVGAIFYSDDLAYTEGLMISNKVYRDYLWPHVREIIKRAKELDTPVIYHTDGRLWDIFDDFYDMGVNAIQPLEPKSMNLNELKEKRGKQFCLIGSIDIDILSRGTKEQVDTMVKERIELLAQDGGYVVGTSNTVPDYINPENYKAMIEATFKYGWY